jgi:hypothetical protein
MAHEHIDSNADWFVVPAHFTRRIARLMKALYNERRMDGDTMRDAAQDLDAMLEAGFTATDDEMAELVGS